MARITIKSNNDTGFGSNRNDYGGRFINKDGSFNVKKQGVHLFDRVSLFHKMLSMHRLKFVLIILAFYLGVNLLYTLLYLWIGLDGFEGIIAKTNWGRLKEIYFFSTETFTTVGYGRVNPIGDGVNFVASIEAMTGFLSFAIATGLIYGRFAKPKAFVAFSDHALIAPYKDRKALMFRFVPYKDNHVLTDASIKVNVGMTVEENGKQVFKFFDLDLERSRVESLSMNWTVVHPLEDNSPLFGMSAEDMKKADVEVYVLVRGFDDVFSSMVLKRTSYTFDEIVFDAKFAQMYHESEDGRTTILELDKLNKYVKLH